MGKLKFYQIDLLKEKDTYLKLDKEDIEKFLSYSFFIGNLMDKRKPIPKRVFNKMMNCFKPAEIEIEKIYKSNYDKIKDNIIKEFLNNEVYDFNYTIDNITYSLEQMVCQMLDDVLPKELTGYFKEKEDVIRTSFQEMKTYIEILKEKTNIEYLDSRLKTIAGYTTICLGYKLSNKKTLTKEMIFQATRNSFKQTKPKK